MCSPSRKMWSILVNPFITFCKISTKTVLEYVEAEFAKHRWLSLERLSSSLSQVGFIFSPVFSRIGGRDISSVKAEMQR